MQHVATESGTCFLVLFPRSFERDSCQVIEFKAQVALILFQKWHPFSRGILRTLKVSLKGIAHTVSATPS